MIHQFSRRTGMSCQLPARKNLRVCPSGSLHALERLETRRMLCDDPSRASGSNDGDTTVPADGVGDGGGWFLDPTPLENSEFQSSIVNAFSADAGLGSPAAGKSDFFTVVAAEMTHLMGLYGGTGMVPLWDAHTSDT